MRSVKSFLCLLCVAAVVPAFAQKADDAQLIGTYKTRWIDSKTGKVVPVSDETLKKIGESMQMRLSADHTFRVDVTGVSFTGTWVRDGSLLRTTTTRGPQGALPSKKITTYKLQKDLKTFRSEGVEPCLEYYRIEPKKS